MWLFLLFAPFFVSAQLPSGIVWDKAVGCQEAEIEYEFNVEEPEECLKVCEHSAVNYTLVGGNPGQWLDVQWHVVGGNIQNSSNTSATIVWGNQGPGNILVTIQTENGFFDRQICIEIIPAPKAGFNIAPNTESTEALTVCEDQTIYFKNLSTTNGGSALMYYEWYFDDDGTTSTEFEPTHIFENPGSYTVSLTVTNGCNCSSYFEAEVEVLAPGVEIICNSMVCENAIDTYTATLAGSGGKPLECGEYLWEAQGGDILSQDGPNVSVHWNDVDEDGFGYLTFFPGEGPCDVECEAPVTIKVPVIKDDIEIDGPDKICEGEQFKYSIPRWPSTQVGWQVISSPSGTNPVLSQSDQPNEIFLTAAKAGFYIIGATYTNTLLNCGGTATKKIEVIPNVSIQGPSNLCVGESAGFSTSFQADWVLNGPGGTQTATGYSVNFTFALPGTYVLGFEQGNACLEQPHNIIVTALPDPPTAINGPLEICLDEAYSYSASPSIGTTHWEVENGTFDLINGTNQTFTTGNTIDVVFKSTSSGPYKLKAWNEINGCVSDTLQIDLQEAVVNYNIFGAGTVCSSTYELYHVDYEGAEEYIWEINPGHLGSITNTMPTDSIEVLWNDVTAPTNVQLVAKVVKCGNLYVRTKNILLQNAPPISINAPSSACREESVNFDIPGLTSWTSITWDFGDGTTATGKNVTHDYTDLNSGNVNYTVSVTVVGGNGCLGTATGTHLIQIEPAPVAYVSPPGASYCSQADLTANPPTFSMTVQSGYPAATTVQWYRQLGGGSVSLSPTNPYQVSPTQFGAYYAVLTSANGCSITTNMVHVNLDNCGPGGPGPGVCTTNGSINSLTAQMSGCLKASASVNLSGTPVYYNWDSNPNGAASNETATGADFSFDMPGNYIISYTATFNGTDDNGAPCTGQMSKTTNLVVPYKAVLHYGIECGTTTGTYDVTLYDASVFFPSTPIQSFDFRVDGNSVGSSGPVTVALTPGPHVLELEISRSGHPSCTATVNIDLPALPTVQIQATSPACVDSPVQFTAIVNDPNLTYKWNFGDLAENSLPDPIRTFTGNPNNPKVTLTVTNQYGCKATGEFDMDILNANMTGDLSLNPSTACYGNPITINYTPTSSSVPTNFYWIYKDENGQPVDTTMTSIGSHTVYEPGTYVLDAENAAGCIARNIASINVAFKETPTASITGPKQICEGDPLVLHASPENENYNYMWKRGGVVRSTEMTVEENLPVGTHNYELQVTTSDGCWDKTNFTVEVYPAPAAPSVNFKLLTCDPYTIQLDAQPPKPDMPGTFTWSDGQSGSSIRVSHGGPYRVTFTNRFGCSSSVQLDVPHSPQAYIWVHPEGCYEVCYQYSSGHELIGPSIPFAYWEWQKNGSVLNSGNGYVPNQGFAGSGFYQLYLHNELCEVQSKGMDWQLTECPECELEVEFGDIHVEYDMYGNCYYVIVASFYNNGAPLSYTVSNQANNGFLVPGGGFADSGYSQQHFTFYPPSGFAGGVINILLEGEIVIEKEPFNCFKEFNINLPPCPPPAPQPTGNSLDGNAFSVAPNPTSAIATVRYNLEGFGEGEYKIALYDLFGRKLDEKVFSKTFGEWRLDLSGYQNGLYLIVLKKEGKTIGFEKINVAR